MISWVVWPVLNDLFCSFDPLIIMLAGGAILSVCSFPLFLLISSSVSVLVLLKGKVMWFFSRTANPQTWEIFHKVPANPRLRRTTNRLVGGLWFAGGLCWISRLYLLCGPLSRAAACAGLWHVLQLGLRRVGRHRTAHRRRHPGCHPLGTGRGVVLGANEPHDDPRDGDQPLGAAYWVCRSQLMEKASLVSDMRIQHRI